MTGAKLLFKDHHENNFNDEKEERNQEKERDPCVYLERVILASIVPHLSERFITQV